MIEVKKTDNEQDIFLVTKYGQCIRFNERDVRSTGRTSMGVIGMNLTDGDKVVGMQMESQGDALMIVSEKGLGKCTLASEFTAQNRGGKGVKCYKITEKTGNIVGVKAVNQDDEMMLITTEGIIIRIKVSDTALLGRVTSGVILRMMSQLQALQKYVRTNPSWKIQMNLNLSQRKRKPRVLRLQQRLRKKRQVR